MTEKRLLMISDMHIGSNASVMPRGITTSTQNSVMPNPLQEYLYDRWEDMLARVEEIGGVDGIANLGDTVDGCNYKQSGVPTWSPDVKLQCEVAASMLGQIKCNRKLYYCSYGSRYHTGENLNSEDYITTLMTNRGYECVVDKDIAFKFGGCYFHLRHESTVSKSIWMYRATHIARETMITLMNDAKIFEGLHNDDDGHTVVLRGHTHQYIQVGHPHSTGMVVPCWKGRDDFVKKISNESPTIGYVIGYCDDGVFDWETQVYSLKGKNLITQHNADEGWTKAPPKARKVI